MGAAAATVDAAVHRAGEKTFVDFSGKRPPLVDRRTGELRRVELFVAVLGASSLTYAEATATRQLADQVGAHTRMVEYFGGATALWVPDQLKSAITRPCRYEPDVNRSYEDLAARSWRRTFVEVSRFSAGLRTPPQGASSHPKEDGMEATATARHVRENGSILAQVEKRALIWMAERLPSRINADHLTILGLLGMVGVGAAYWASNWCDAALLAAVAGLALHWFGDSLDGTIARVRNQQRPRYGYYVDHVVDITSALLLCAGLALSPYMTPTVALLLLAAYLMISAETFLATHACGVFRVSLLKVGPTELRILLAVGTLCLHARNPVVELFGRPWLLFDVGGLVAAVGMLGALALSVARNGRALYRAEPIVR